MSNQYTVLKDDYELAKQLGQAMGNHPDIVRDEKRFSSLLSDILGVRQLEVNILRILVKEGMLNEMMNKQDQDDHILNRFVLVLQQRYAIADDVARRMAWILLYGYRAGVQKKQVAFQIVSDSFSNNDSNRNTKQNKQDSSLQKETTPVLKNQIDHNRAIDNSPRKQEIANSTAKPIIRDNYRHGKKCPSCGLPVKDSDRYCPAGHPQIVTLTYIDEYGDIVRTDQLF